MSPGPTFERVYLALKKQLRTGHHAPGAHLEPAVLTDELCSSITPIRDALHRLVGERLVETPRNDGFRVPIVTEFALRQLYSWQTALLHLAASRYAGEPERKQDDLNLESPASDQTSTSGVLFLELARNSSNAELSAALVNACDRLAPFRDLEERFIPGLEEELQQLRSLAEARDLGGLRAAITAHNKRRDRAVPQIVAALQGSF
jgi:DNA-binding GntR family transcriptional regulator